MAPHTPTGSASSPPHTGMEGRCFVSWNSAFVTAKRCPKHMPSNEEGSLHSAGIARSREGPPLHLRWLPSWSCRWFDFKGSRKTAQNIFSPLTVTPPPFKQPFRRDHILFAKPRADSQGFAAGVWAKAEPGGERRDLGQCLVGTQQPPPHQAKTNTECPENAASHSPGDLPNMLERGGDQESQLRDRFKVSGKF